MATYRITAPDGGTYEITAPDGATQEQVLAYAQANYQSAAPGQQAAPRADFSGVQGGSRSSESAPATGLKRDLGMSARSVLQGAGGLIGAIGGDAFNHYLMPGDQPSYRDAASALADRIGLPKPKTAQERVLGDVGEALTGTGMTFGIGGLLSMGRAAAPAATQRIGQLLTTQPGLQTVSTATGSGAASATREAGGTQGQQVTAGLLGALAPGGLSSGSSAAVRGAVRGRSGAQMQQTIDDFARLGATPSVGQASGNHALQGVENLLAGAPTSGGVMARFAERQADDIGQGLQARADAFQRGASAERAGRAVEQGVGVFSRNTNAVKRALYWQADRFIPEATPVQLSNTWQTVAKLTTPTQGATATTGALINPRIAQLRDTLAQDIAAGNGRIPYAALKRIRTDIGESLADYSLSPDTPTRELKQLYAALSRDMETAAQAMGPDAVRAAKRANRYTRATADRLEQVQRVIDKNGGPEKVFQAAMSGTRDGGTTLRAVMQSLPKEGQRSVTAAVIKRMGMPTPGQAGVDDTFSAATFLTNWNRISPEARKALFDRHGLGFSQDMDRIARVADNVKAGSKVFANPSGTANKAAAYTYGASLVASMFDPTLLSAGTLIGGGALANGAARYMTNPDAVRWLARSTTMPRGAFVSSLAELGRRAEKDDDDDLRQLAADLRDAVEQQAGTGQ